MRVELDTQKLQKKLSRVIDQTQIELDNQVLKDSNFYAPEDEEFLKASAITGSQPGTGVLNWNTPYAARLYYGDDFTFSKDKNPNAQARWFEVAKSRNKKNWIKLAGKRFKK